MTKASASADIPTHPVARREWIKAMLRAEGWTLTRLAQHCGVRRQAVSAAFFLPVASVERAIGEILERPLHDLWPDRYTPAGNRVVRTLPPNSSRMRQQGNTKPGAAA